MSDLKQEMARVFALQGERRAAIRATTAAQRIEKLKKLKAAILAHLPEAIAALGRDAGKPAFEAAGECMSPLGEIDTAVANLEEWMKPTQVQPSGHAAPGTRARVLKEPKGRVLIFGPWNFPFALLFQPFAGAIAAGNACILKPSELTPATSAVAAKIVREVFEAGEVAIFEGGPEVAGALLDLPFDHIFFTGSTKVGKLVMAAAARHLSSITLELGGKCPAVLDEGIDLAQTAGRIGWGKYLNAGQLCLSPDHVWVKAATRDAFVAELVAYTKRSYVADGSFNFGDLTQIIDDRNMQRLTKLLDDAVSRGAKIVHGGGVVRGLTRTIEPTILVDVPRDAALMQEEIFGPILPVLTYRDNDDVVTEINSRDKPLALYVFSDRPTFVDDILSRTSSGGVTVNHVVQHCVEPNLPFGGVGASGMGVYHGIYTFLDFSHQRSVYYQGESTPMESFARPPYAGKLEMLQKMLGDGAAS
jgi:aldehyde dehydrogenase (NAD+)